MRIRESKLIYDGWTRFLVLEVEGPDAQRVTKAVLDHGEAACVLPYDSERRTALLVGQQRVPQLYLGQAEPSLEAIAGRLEPDEAVEESIRREAEEEAGLRLRELEKVATCWASPGVSTERIHLYLAAYSPADRTGPGGGRAEELENIEVKETALSELSRRADLGSITDAKTMLLIQTLRLRQPHLFA
jgi:nudix-type nucleoside diphosphatase (YffH/AdpP family)